MRGERSFRVGTFNTALSNESLIQSLNDLSAKVQNSNFSETDRQPPTNRQTDILIYRIPLYM